MTQEYQMSDAALKGLLHANAGALGDDPNCRASTRVSLSAAQGKGSSSAGVALTEASPRKLPRSG